MRRFTLMVGSCMFAVAWPLMASNTQAPLSDVHFPFYVYHGFQSPENHFVPSGWMGDYGDVQLDAHWKDKAAKNQTVIRIAYSGKSTQSNGWAGMYWQNPANNWGSRPGGFNLNGARHVVFSARGEKGQEMIAEFKIGGISGNYSDSGSAAIGPITLTKEWKQYKIDLGDQELSNIIGGFCWTINRDQNPKGATFYLDEIRYE